MFYNFQTPDMQQKYKDYLRISGSLSKLFSESTTPYLYYRAAENIFCKAFDADDLSRSDVSADAKKGHVGIGLKTFLHNNGRTLQKVAEFNAISGILRDKDIDETIRIVSESRNTRIQATRMQYGLESIIYHCVTRDTNVNKFYEFPMDEINIGNLNISAEVKNSIKFTDGVNEYSFNRSKNTLFKRFNCTHLIDQVNIDIFEDPFDLLATIQNGRQTVTTALPLETIYLPLYAPSSQIMEPAEKSGLNQWNASGRERHSDEVYIPIPAWIHHKFPDFFPESNDISFELSLPDGTVLSASTCQSGQKGLMSNPNKDLGKWLLRDVLHLGEGTLVTRDILNMADIDSATIEKVSENQYKIDFTSVGQYELFKERHEV